MHRQLLCDALHALRSVNFVSRYTTVSFCCRFCFFLHIVPLTTPSLIHPITLVGFVFLSYTLRRANNYSFCLTREAFSMHFGARRRTQKLFSREQLSSSFHLCFLLFLCTLLLCCFFYLDARDQRKDAFLRWGWLSCSCKQRWNTQGEREKENSTAGFVSSFSSVWLPHICWPFQPSQRPPSISIPPSSHTPFRSQAQGFICLCSLPCQSVEIRGEHKPAWSEEKGGEMRGGGGWGERKKERGWDRERE